MIGQDFTLPKTLSADSLARSAETAKLHIEMSVTLRRGCAYLEFNTAVDNTAKNHRLRAAFPTDCATETAYAGQPFDVVERPVQPENVNACFDGEYEPYVGYGPMQDFCGISDGVRGAAVAGDGILEYEVLPMRKTVAVTLLRATDRLLVGVLATGSKFRLDAAQLQGKISFRYAFVPHAGGYENALRGVESFRHPVIPAQKDFLEEQSMPTYRAPAPVLPLSCGFVRVDGTAVMTALKPSSVSEGEVILRVYSPLKTPAESVITIDGRYSLDGAKLVRMDERADEERPIPFCRSRQHSDINARRKADRRR